ncbi:hypothetical protein DAPPUDRAFT_239046 [Daphnia pulex]|uniref:Uncharacterized protein n=1 Tax=Daphnia pulex TaxID=6669 RepID=E9G867_DAPPU|nr:hypothetical protein DAPPUDRAFT_239046 [Daphnia pulex]|eukprot:EFX84329.1 hypothetical protein DAPPUDRAFT_239046 [Daphnia pulex]
MQARNLCLRSQNHSVAVVNLQDVDAFARSNSLLPSICGQQQENAATQDFVFEVQGLDN